MSSVLEQEEEGEGQHDIIKEEVIAVTDLEGEKPKEVQPLKEEKLRDESVKDEQQKEEQSVEEEQREQTKDDGKHKHKKVRKKKEKTKKIKGPQHDFDFPGVTKMIITDLCQKFINLMVGEHITAEEPWTYVEKEKLMDHLELHEGSSEFLAVHNEIAAYPEKTLLVGYIAEECVSGNDYFYLVTNLESKEKVLEVIERKKKEMEIRLQKSLVRPVGGWVSLGSESEVDLEMMKNLRPLYEIELESRFPLTDATVSFKCRHVEDVRDGYVELLPDARYPITNVDRKRVDASVQAAPETICNIAQTIPKYPTNVWTQYEYEVPELPVVGKHGAHEGSREVKGIIFYVLYA